MHEALVEETLGDELIGHVSSTAIEAREKPAPKPKAKTPKRKPAPLRRSRSNLTERQVNGMDLDEIPTALRSRNRSMPRGLEATSYISYSGLRSTERHSHFGICP